MYCKGHAENKCKNEFTKSEADVQEQTGDADVSDDEASEDVE